MTPARLALAAAAAAAAAAGAAAQTLAALPDFRSIPLLGDFDALAYKYVNVHVGGGAALRAIVDTGSSLLAFPCADCAASACAPAHARLDAANATAVTCAGAAAGEAAGVAAGDAAAGAAGAEPAAPAPACTSCGPADECRYARDYAEGSALEGRYVRAGVSLGARGAPPVRMTLGCHSRETGLFTSQEADGILGLSGGALSLPRALAAAAAGAAGGAAAAAAAAAAPPDAPAGAPAPFALCAARRGGVLTLGAPDARRARGPARSTPLRVEADGFYRVRVADVRLIAPASWCAGGGDATLRGGGCARGGGTGGTSVVAGGGAPPPLPPPPDLGPWPLRGDALLDSGSSYSYVPPRVLAAVERAVRAACWGVDETANAAAAPPSGGGARRCAGARTPAQALPSGQALCARLDAGDEAAALATFPALELALESGAAWRVPARALFMRTPWTAGLHCLQLFSADEVAGRTVLGTNAMLDYDVAFAPARGEVSWADADCAARLPPPPPRGAARGAARDAARDAARAAWAAAARLAPAGAADAARSPLAAALLGGAAAAGAARAGACARARRACRRAAAARRASGDGGGAAGGGAAGARRSYVGAAPVVV
jgi:hypothetical protein